MTVALSRPTLNTVLERQLRRLHLSASHPPDAAGWASLLARVDAAYADAEQQRYLAERSLAVSSHEMQVLNERLESSQLRLEAVFDAASVGLCVIAPDGAVEAMNPAALTVLGVVERDVLGESLSHIMTITSRRDPSCSLDEGSLPSIVTAVDPWRCDEATVRCGERSFPAGCALTPLRGDDGQCVGAVLVLRDLTAEYREQAGLAWRATHDALTGLANRDQVMKRLTDSLSHATHEAGRLALLFVDLDRFKTVNDSLGHAAGDSLIVMAARRLSTVVRGEETVGRLAGDEFVVISETTSSEGAMTLAQRIVSELEKPFTIDGVEVLTSASVGAVMSRTDSTATEMLAEADHAMYAAKLAGRGCVRLFDERSRSETQSRLALETRLRHAIKNRELSIALQRNVELSTGRITGFELLSRWVLPDGSSVSPAVFVPMAEELGVINELGGRVLDEAVRALAEWAGAIRGLSLSVNVSGRQLQRPAFVDRLGALLTEHRVDPSRLTLEVTESVFLEDPAAALAQLAKLRELGVRLAIDDFGTGYSSLSYLRRLPIDEVKIDREFVTDLTSSKQGRTIVDSVVRMCHALGFRVVAEGVETAEQAQLLGSLGCDAAQGWYFGRPQSPASARALFHSVLV